MAMVRVSPKFGVCEIIFKAFKKLMPCSNPPLISNVTIPPPSFICFLARAYCGCDGRKGYFTLMTFEFVSRYCARRKEFSQCFSIRMARVSKLLESNQALKGAIAGPVCRV